MYSHQATYLCKTDTNGGSSRGAVDNSKALSSRSLEVVCHLLIASAGREHGILLHKQMTNLLQFVIRLFNKAGFSSSVTGWTR